jgi:hypothetical protein
LRVDGDETGRPVAERDRQDATGLGPSEGGGVDDSEVAEHAGEGLLGAGELDPGRLPDDAAAAVAADDVPGPQVRVAHGDGDTVGVLREPGDGDAAGDRHTQSENPFGELALGLRLCQEQRVPVPAVQGGEVEPGLQAGEVPSGHRPALGQERVGEPALVQHLDAARVQGERSRVALRRVASFQDPHPDSGQGQFPGQHQSGGAGAHHDHIGVHATFLPLELMNNVHVNGVHYSAGHGLCDNPRIEIRRRTRPAAAARPRADPR